MLQITWLAGKVIGLQSFSYSGSDWCFARICVNSCVWLLFQ